MEKYTLSKSLARYSALAAAAIAGISSANAQIQYTDKSPGDVYNTSGNFNIDIDGDGNSDFSLVLNSGQNTVQGSQTGTMGGHYTWISGFPTGGGTMGGHYTWIFGTTTISGGTNGGHSTWVPGTATGGGTTGGHSSWISGIPVYRQYHNWFASANLNAIGSQNQVIGSSNAYALAKPNHVSGYGSWNGGNHLLAKNSFYYSNNYSYGNFQDNNLHYIGIKFSNASGIHYGWVRLQVTDNSHQVTVLDYGYEKTPNASIHAGGIPTTYTNAGSGLWSDASNWDKGIPSAADDAVISAGQSVTIDAPATCFNFINNGSVALGSSTINVGGHFKSTGNAFNEGTGTVNLTGDFSADATRKITGAPLKSLGLHIYNLSVNNSNVSYLLDEPLIVDNNLNITNDNDFDINTGDYVTVQGSTTIDANLTNDGTMSLKSSNIINGSLTNNGTLSVYGNTTNNGTLNNTNSFTFVSDASGTASFLNSGTVNGTFDVQKYLTDGRWWYVGPPVNGVQSSSFGPLSTTPLSGTRLFNWNEIAGSYTNLTLGTEYLDALHGYAYKNFDGAGPNTADFSGNLHDGPIGDLDNVTRTITGIYDGYNLVSNPYPSAIDLGNSTTPTPGLVMTNLEPTIWYRTNGNFATYNWTSGTGQNTGQQIIPAMQAFWVRVASGNTTGTYNIDNQSRLHSSQAFYKKADDQNIFRIEVSNNSLTDEAVVTFNQDAQPGYENFDSEKMLTTDDNVPQIFTLTSDNMQVAINGEPELGIGEEKIIPLGFITNIAGTFTLNASNLTTFQPGVDVYLEDALSGTIIDLRQTNSYTFSSAIVNNADRFRLHFGSITTNIVSENIATAVAYSFDNTIYVNTPSDNCSIELYDMLGNLIINKLSVKGLNILQTGVSKGVYIVKIINGSKVSTEKIMIQK